MVLRRSESTEEDLEHGWPFQPRRRPRRRRHHERDAGRAAGHRRAGLERQVFESGADGGRGELRPVEQRRHRALRALRAQLHARPAPTARVDPAKAVASTSSSRCRGSSGRTWCGPACTDSPKTFITSVPHISFVTGEDGRAYMRDRATRRWPPSRCSPAWSTPTTPPSSAEWVPLMMAGRDRKELVAATRSAGRHRRQLRRADPAAARRRRPPRCAVHLQPAGAQGLRRERRRPLGGRPSATRATGERAHRAQPGSSSSGAGGGALPLLQRRRHPGDQRGSAGSRSAASSCAPAHPSWSRSTRRRSTARPRSARRRCRCRTWTCA